MKGSVQTKQDQRQDQAYSKSQTQAEQQKQQDFLKLNLPNPGENNEKEKNYPFMYDCMKQQDLTNIYYQQLVEPSPLYMTPWELNTMQSVNSILLNPSTLLKDCIEHYQVFVSEVQQFKTRAQARQLLGRDARLENLTSEQLNELQFNAFSKRVEQYGPEYPVVHVYRKLVESIQMLLKEYQEQKIEYLRINFYEYETFIRIPQIFINIAIIQLQNFYRIIYANFQVFKKNIGSAPKLNDGSEKMDKQRCAFFMRELKKQPYEFNEIQNRGFKRALSVIARLTQYPELTDQLDCHLPLFKDDNLDLGQNILTRELAVQGSQTPAGKIPNGSVFLAVPYIVYTQYIKEQNIRPKNREVQVEGQIRQKPEAHQETNLMKILQCDNVKNVNISQQNPFFIQAQYFINFTRDKQTMTTFYSSLDFLKSMLQQYDYIIYTCDKADLSSPFLRNRQSDLEGECFYKIIDHTDNTVTLLLIRTETYIRLHDISIALQTAKQTTQD